MNDVILSENDREKENAEFQNELARLKLEVVDLREQNAELANEVEVYKERAHEHEQMRLIAELEGLSCYSKSWPP